MNQMNRTSNKHNRKATAVAMLASVLFFNTTAHADVDIHIAGDVYGGGKNGAVGTEHLAAEGVDVSDINKINLSEPAISDMISNITHSTRVVVNAGNVRTVFGGGQNGRVYGLTLAEINGGVIGGPEWEGSIYGGVFGAGDGAEARVFGIAHTLIQGGTIYNNVYGGGNQADLIGSAVTRLESGTIYGNVFGSARMADMMGFANVNIAYTGSNKSPLYVKAVYGGNDISGTAANSSVAGEVIGNGYWNWITRIPAFAGKATVVRKTEGNQETSEWEPILMTTTTSYGNVEIAKNANGAINNTAIWNNTVVSHSVEDKDVFIGNLFAGGNGDYTYTDGKVSLRAENSEGELVPTAIGESLSAPDVDRAYLEIEGGCFGNIYGGGNNATVTQSTDIYINNPDEPCLVPADIIAGMGVQKSSYKIVEDEGRQYARFEQTMDRVFGGNNLATMSIQPNWYLHDGRINNLYGGGNKGNMTCANGILVNIFKNKPGEKVNGVVSGNTENTIKINNLYGGCRMADVKPMSGGALVAGLPEFERFGHSFPADYSSRVYITGGIINNVYGGNDISGQIFKGADVEIFGAVSGDVYGGGNGAYPYTDNAALAQAAPDEWGDYYYDKDGGMDLTNSADNASESLAGLYLKRPHVESTMVHIAGEGEFVSESDWDSQYGPLSGGGAVAKLVRQSDGTWRQVDMSAESTDEYKNKPGQLLGKGEMRDVNRVYVMGGVYCGGNSATVDGTGANATLKIGRCVTIDKVFLGSNGARMVDEELLKLYQKDAVTVGGTSYSLAKFSLKGGSAVTVNGVTYKNDMAAYMDGCSMNIMPAIEYDFKDNTLSDGKTEVDVDHDKKADMDPEGLNFSSRIGSFFCGGNVGSMTVAGTIGENIDKEKGLRFPRELVIYDKVVGGCNNANVPESAYNDFYLGGVTGSPEDPVTHTANKAKYIDGDKAGTQVAANDPGIKIQLYIPCRMEPRYLNKVAVLDSEGSETGFYTVDATEPEPWSAPVVISDHGIESDHIGLVQILDRGNIYGGCYQSGYVNGSVQIDIKDELCATAQMRAYFGDKQFQGQLAGQDGTAAVVDNMRRYVLNHGWSVFGGGYGLETEIWGNVYLNLSRNAGYINAYGGSQMGFIGKMDRADNGKYNTVEATIKTTTIADENSSTVMPTDKIIKKYSVTTPYDTYVNLRNDIHRSPVSIFGLNALYGGGYQGVVTGNTHMYAGGGLHYDVFGGACNADIYGYTEVFVGSDREGNFDHNLQLRHCVYGGNDFGGQILGAGVHNVTFKGADGENVTKNVLSNTYVQYLGGTIERDIYGGSCGLYRYDGKYKWEGPDGTYTEFGPDGEASIIHASASHTDGYNLYPADSYTTLPTLFNNPAEAGNLPAEASYDEAHNTFVDIACGTDYATSGSKMGNIILGNIFGGGYGFCNEIGRVDTKNAYVVLHGPETGLNRLAAKVYGGGYFSYVENSTVDAVSGRVDEIYGGTSGTTVDAAVANKLKSDKEAIAKTQKTTWGTDFDPDTYQVLSEFDVTQLTKADYTSKNTVVNIYPSLQQNKMLNVFGAGAYTGSDNTEVNLYGGLLNEVYGGANQEGVCGSVLVNVPGPTAPAGSRFYKEQGSAVVMNALYGGGHGSYKALPCDVRDAVIEFHSSTAKVNLGSIYGGNNEYRATRNATINYSAKATDVDGRHLNIFGAGNGELSVAARTRVNIAGTAQVLNVYGGGNEGSVFYKYDILTDPYTGSKPVMPVKPERAAEESDADYNARLAEYDTKLAAFNKFHDASNNLRYKQHETSHAGLSYAHWYETEDMEQVAEGGDMAPVYQTNVQLALNAVVDGSVCGAGYGSKSVVAGHTLVENHGAFVSNDIFGGGYNGNVRKMVKTDTGYRDEDYEMIIQEDKNTPRYNDNVHVTTLVNMTGGKVRNIFGGGYSGSVGESRKPARLTDTDESKLTEDKLYLKDVHDYSSSTTVNFGKEVIDITNGGVTQKVLLAGQLKAEPEVKLPTLTDGDPDILLSLYGAGDRGAVFGNSYVNMYNGHIGFNYVDGNYVEYLKPSAAEENDLYKEDGNLYGGGFGEDARVLNTDVRFYDGVIRNSLYGGGEMSAVGWGSVTIDPETDEPGHPVIEKIGSTKVVMYGGLVQADVFGGGRGYSYDNFGKMMYGNKYHTDGFVFGKTDCNVVRGQVGTETTLLEENGAHGNVFGGGNVGYVYSGDGVKWADAGGTGYYYLKSGHSLAGVESIQDKDGFTTYVTTEETTGGGTVTTYNKILTEDARVKVKVYGRALDDIESLPQAELIIQAGQRVPEDVYASMTDAQKATVLPGVLLATEDFTYQFPTEYGKGDYIPNEVLNTLTANELKAKPIDLSGVTIKNAVFAGGNVSKGSDRIYAYSKTVYGNATASLVDVYSCDLMAVAGDGYGGLYGDGNLTFVDGYRELNITNYGTDYYSLYGSISVDEYNALSDREKSFYTTKYTCKIANGPYVVNDVITSNIYNSLDPGYKTPEYWEQTESIVNAGRFLNTIQRADYCGLKGSRLILNGAEDRAQGTDEADYTKYSVNRIGELSFNRNNGVGSNATAEDKQKVHGSYFGIYNVVKYLSSMSSDYDFFAGLSGHPSLRTTTHSDVPANWSELSDTEKAALTGMAAPISKDWRITDGITDHSASINYGSDPGYSFFNWKADHAGDDIRNNGSCMNELALASGVYLELIKEPAAGTTTKEYGPVIGVVQLDLMNVTPGEGGGYVYARNNHGEPSFSEEVSHAAILSDDNQGLKTCRGYLYADNTEGFNKYNGIVTSGNFVNPVKTIIDDCFPVADDLGSDAHYWYIKGNTYVYEQLISAYTGMANTYKAELDLPLSVSGKVDTKFRLINVLPGLYTNPDNNNVKVTYQKVEKLYQANDPISFWEWYNIPAADQSKFLLNTYVCVDPVRYVSAGGETITFNADKPITKEQYDALPVLTKEDITLLDDDGEPLAVADYPTHITGLKDCFRPSNEVSDANGYTLTVDLSNPAVWNDYYTARYPAGTAAGEGTMTINGKIAATTVSTADVEAHRKNLKDSSTNLAAFNNEFNSKYIQGATFNCTETGTYGQDIYIVSDIISKSVYDLQNALPEDVKSGENQARFVDTYVVRQDCKVWVKVDGTATEVNLVAGNTVSSADIATYLKEDGATQLTDAEKAAMFERGYVCINTLMLSETDYRTLGRVIGYTEYMSYKDDENNSYEDNFQLAYSCTKDGSWGGRYFVEGHNYSGYEYSTVYASERDNFEFNKDALDLLLDAYEPYNVTSSRTEASVLDALAEGGGTRITPSNLAKYDRVTGEPYSLEIPFDYTAVYKGTGNLVYQGSGYTKTVSTSGAEKELTADEFSNLPNDRKYYSKFTLSDATVENGGNKMDDGTYLLYISKAAFSVGDVLYNIGTAINPKEYDNLTSTQKGNFSEVTMPESSANGTYYYCNKEYTVGANDGYVDGFTSQGFSDIKSVSHTKGSTIAAGTIITSATMTDYIPNEQAKFTLIGNAPKEETTLYVPVTSDIYSLSKDRYVTVIYEYEYTEGDNTGMDYETTVERHIINIRLKFESDQPEVGPLLKPDVVLPLEQVTITPPYVIPGAFDIINGGWEIYRNEEDANKHRNGHIFNNGADDAYWYQNGYWIAYYAETKMGRTFSKPVQITVANYHRILDLTAANNYLFIDHEDIDRNAKVYIGYDLDKSGGQAPDYSTQLEALKTFFQETTDGINNSADGYSGDEYDRKVSVVDCNNLEFFINNDIDMSGVDGISGWQVEAYDDPAHPSDETLRCFQGNLHGNGHTIMGLRKSLFKKLCGDVYNLGVIGEFAGAGVADHGEGRAENCWVWTTRALGESETSLGSRAVMGDDGASVNPATVVNCYYPSTNAFVAGSALPRPVNEFINGQVAYDLNRFYLEARYARNAKPATTSSLWNNYSYTRKADGVVDTEPAIVDGETVNVNKLSGYVYDNVNNFITFSTLGAKNSNTAEEGEYHHFGYVEALYADGDFRYAQGLKPTTEDMRMSAGTIAQYVPVYPDDYIFFGQKLTYGLYSEAHELHPYPVRKSVTEKLTDGTVDNSKNGFIRDDATIKGNRLYRAPAYFRNSTEYSAIFNKDAAFVDKAHVMDLSRFTDLSAIEQEENNNNYQILPGDGYVPVTGARSTGFDDDPVKAENVYTGTPYYPHLNMTAVDFTGYRKSTSTLNEYTRIDFEHAIPYLPLLDFEGLTGFETQGLTQNLLVYSPDEAADAATHTLLEEKLPEPVFTYNTPTATGGDAFEKAIYNSVLDAVLQKPVKGHLVEKNTESGTYIAGRDHYLVDAQDFNCPVSFKYGDNNVMWYQRKPANYANAVHTTDAGGNYVQSHDAWESLVLPFTAKMVSTTQKGEVTHFYGDDITGHEYWLRQFYALKAEGVVDVATADFRRPDADNNESAENIVNNTFLWDYYYNDADGINHKDANADDYQTYYNTSRTYQNYAYLTAGVPYIISFPGSRYYEFDMSGQFTPSNTAAKTWSTLRAGGQNITYVSAVGATIGVSDNLAMKASVNKPGSGTPVVEYVYTGTFLNDAPEAVSAGGKAHYAINAAGTQFDKVFTPEPLAAGATTEQQTAYNNNVSAAKYVPFRAYFNVAPSASGAPERSPLVRSIVIGGGEEANADGRKDAEEYEELIPGLNTRGINIYGKDGAVWFESSLCYEVTLPLYTSGGKLLGRITVPAMEKVAVPVSGRGVFLAGHTKVLVR